MDILYENVIFLSMTMLSKIFTLLDNIFRIPRVYAHCDIPCGIYSTHQAGVAAETVKKMTQKITELGTPTAEATDAEKIAWHNNLTRMIHAKEEWAQICKQELLILWTDYFKQEHLELFPSLHAKFWDAAKLCSQNKREVNLSAARSLRTAVEEISEIFKKAEGEKAAR